MASTESLVFSLFEFVHGKVIMLCLFLARVQTSQPPNLASNTFTFQSVRCNDAIELVQTMKHFQILATTVLIGGADNQSLDIITQEVYSKYEKSINEFRKNVNDIMVLNSEKNNFETSFFHLRTTIKVETKTVVSDV
jgi:hypothetical protein